MEYRDLKYDKSWGIVSITMVILLAVFVIGINVNHGLFVHELGKALTTDDPQGTISINPITNTVTISVDPAKIDDNPFGTLGLAMVAAMAPQFEREFATEFNARAKKERDVYVYLVPFSVKIETNLLEIMTRNKK